MQYEVKQEVWLALIGARQRQRSRRGGVTSPHQPCRQFGLVCFAHRRVDLCTGRMAD